MEATRISQRRDEKEMGGRIMPPISFWPPCRVPPDPPQAKLVLGVYDAARSEPAHRVTACVGVLLPPAGPPISCPTSRTLSQQEGVFHRKTNHFALIRYCCGVLVTTKQPETIAVTKLSQKKRAACYSGPVRSFVMKAECDVRARRIRRTPGDFRMQV